VELALLVGWLMVGRVEVRRRGLWNRMLFSDLRIEKQSEQDGLGLDRYVAAELDVFKRKPVAKTK
jgi:hypothetical protein